MKKNQSTTGSNRRKLILATACFLILAIFATILLYANIQFQKTAVLSKTADIRGLHYSVEQQPSRPLSGQPITFRVRITKNGSPVKNTDFSVGTSHSYGIFIRDAGLDSNIDETARSDDDGRLTFSYIPSFNYPTKDTYGFGVAPSTSDEKVMQDFREREAKGIDRVGSPYGPTFDVVIYPRWLSWFKLR